MCLPPFLFHTELSPKVPVPLTLIPKNLHSHMWIAASSDWMIGMFIPLPSPEKVARADIRNHTRTIRNSSDCFLFSVQALDRLLAQPTNLREVAVDAPTPASRYHVRCESWPDGAILSGFRSFVSRAIHQRRCYLNEATTLLQDHLWGIVCVFLFLPFKEYRVRRKFWYTFDDPFLSVFLITV